MSPSAPKPPSGEVAPAPTRARRRSATTAPPGTAGKPARAARSDTASANTSSAQAGKSPARPAASAARSFAEPFAPPPPRNPLDRRVHAAIARATASVSPIALLQIGRAHV